MKTSASDRLLIKPLLIIVLFTGPIIPSGLSFILGSFLLILLVGKTGKISLNEILITLPLIGIVIIGIFGTIINLRLISYKELYLFGKDIWYFIKPIVYLLIGFYIFRVKISKEYLLSIIIITAVITGIYHIIRVLIFIFSSENSKYILDSLKAQTSFTSIFESVSLAYVLNKERYSGLKGEIYLSRWFIIMILLISVALSFSRTMIIAFIVSLLALNNFFSFRLRILIRFIFLFTIIIVSGYLILVLAYNTSSKNSNLHLFSGKFLNSFNEVTYKKTTPTFKEINSNWRGYESNLTNEVIRKGDIIDKTIGFGFGKTVFIGYSGFLGPTNIFIPLFHNGFVELRLKTGYLGLFLYFCFFLIAFWITDRNYPSTEYDNLLKALLVISFLSTLVITGLYNKTVFDPSCVLIGYLISMNIYKKYFSKSEKTI